MSTVCKKNNISKKEIQEIIEKNYKVLKIPEEKVKRVVKAARSNFVSKEMRIILGNLLERMIVTNFERSEKGQHLTRDERIIIQVLKDVKFSNNFIANLIDKERSTIGREVNRNSIEVEDLKHLPSKTHPEMKMKKLYDAEVAQDKYESRRIKCRKQNSFEKYPEIPKYLNQMDNKKVRYGADIFAYLINSGKASVEGKISHQTIYNHAHKGTNGITMLMFPHGAYKEKTENTHNQYNKIPERKAEYSIEKMPEETKESILYFEGDSVIGKKEGTHNTLQTYANPISKFLLIHRSKDKTAKSTCETLVKIRSEIFEGQNLMKDILYDNGVEFSDIKGMMVEEKTGEKVRNVYFAHPYTSCERGCNENKNREIRVYIPKGVNIDEVSDEYIEMTMIKINNKPRKSLGYKTALEKYEEELKKIGINTDFLDKYRKNIYEYQKCKKIS